MEFMKNIIGKFFKAIRQRVFAARIRSEIYGKIFPHLRQEANHGYPFGSDEQIVERNMTAFLATGSMVRLIEQAASKMPKSEGDAFRHIAYRDLQERMWRYVEFARERMQPADYGPRFVATRATA
jgi:hypothetical protein